ncbi:unnamed protein product, partial [Rotaria magnacalcarata]
MVLRTSLNNSGDTVKCRGASATATVPIGVVADKCAGICNTFPGATLATDNCTMSYTASVVGFWAVSLMMEDYEFTWQTTPLSATSLQFLVQLYTSRSSSCIVGPAYTENRPVGACVGVDINQTVVETATFSVGCTGVTFSDVLTTSPPGMARDVITQSTTNALVYSITITWIPPASAWGEQTTASTTIASILTVSTLGVSTTTANANITTTGITVPSSTTLCTGTSSTIRTTITSTTST